jgi:hypothetical protein
MKHFTETQIKYLAGLIDADGSLFFHFREYKEGVHNVTLKLVLQQSISIDHNGAFMKSLPEYFGFNQEIELASQNPNWADANRWTVNNQKDLNMLIPRLTKHMVIKAKHFDRLLNEYNSLYGKSVTTEDMMALKELATVSRSDTGPLKPKKHPTWAWVAGYLDGDGCYYMRNRKKNWGVSTELLVRVVAHNDDICGLGLLEKAFNGNFKKSTNEDTHYWTRNLGNADKAFALHFLRKMHMHSQLKRHKIELMLHYHLQRLNESAPEGDAIVCRV